MPRALWKANSWVVKSVPCPLTACGHPDLAVFVDTTRPVVTVVHWPDVVIEVKSPDDTYASIRERAQYYLAHGARLVWLLYPAKGLVEVYRQGADSDLLTCEDTLQGEDVLPGFTLAVHEIFSLP